MVLLGYVLRMVLEVGCGLGCRDAYYTLTSELAGSERISWREDYCYGEIRRFNM